MSLCELCMAQVDRPGHFPPHPRLVKASTFHAGVGGNAFVYRCQVCGQTILLSAATEDGPDRWTHLKSTEP
ncbi:hypothetical protein [Cupriavidus basilensis]|uniref:hypothetical protein n=1 Tax=Cupriavidus basilensis TaxID=68895 RepID=UPI000750F5ED|nr:hypothetical protein [Cupriavidus basilensis]